MELLVFNCGPLQNNTYLLIDGQTSILFDAPMESFNKISEFLDKRNLSLNAIILTHSHFDHIIDLSKFENKYQPIIFVHPKDEYRIANPNEHIPLELNIKIQAIEQTEPLNDNQIIEFENIRLKILHTPGHTEGSICIEILGERKIITGDTLFSLSIGRTDFPGGNYEQIINSIKNKLLVYDDDYIIFPGHGPKSSIGNERKNNRFLN